MKKMSTSDASEFIIDVKDVRPAKRHPKCCIYKVPNKLREVREEAYTPKLISIGPVHHNKEEQDNNKEQDTKKEQAHKKELENMESLKLRYFKEFFCQTTCESQKEFANVIEKREKDIRHCYAEEISLPEKKDFVKMILVDSIFIIELFLRTAARQEYEKDDYILSKPWLEEGIKHDLILLENQLPFFILEELHHHIECSSSIHKSFIELAWSYFFPNNYKNMPKGKEVKHFTDLRRYFYYSPKLKSKDSIIPHLYSATELDTAGLNFKKWEKIPSEVEDRRLLDIQIKRCFLFEKFPRIQTSLVVPPFVINHGTEHLFRNLMAFEQCHYPFQAYICNYIVLLDFLINTREDADLLVNKKIIVHSLGNNKEVAKMVNRLCKEILERNSCYYQVACDLNRHHHNWWNKNIASLKNKNIASLKTVYFRDIWRGTATIVGIIVLLVTIGSFLTPFFLNK